MAIQDKNIRAAEHDWYATRSGLPGNAPLMDHKAAYFAAKGFGSNASVFKPVSQMESDWLDNLGGDWMSACQSQGITPTVSETENMFRFFTGVASGTNP